MVQFGFTILFTACLAMNALPTEILEQQKWVVGQPVKTTSGEVSGHDAAWPAGAGVSEYLGIPFAQPPVGDLRFEKPVAFRGDGKISGEKFASDCIQFTRDYAGLVQNGLGSIEVKGLDKDVLNFGKAYLGGPNGTYEEDCLYLNVWSKPQTGEKNKAVLVWVYGGADSIGATSAPYYNPARYAAEHDMVAVSINYRLSIFGFPMAPIFKDQNFGLYDQRLAIEWIRDNIEAFGGDPKRITIFGESAGGASVDYYSYAWKDDPIVAGLISQSGTAAGLIGDNPNGAAWWLASKALGCGGESEGAKSIACMKKLPAETLLKGVNAANPISILTFWPVNDNKTVFADILWRQKRGDFMKKPMLIGNMDNESGLVSGFAIILRNVLEENAAAVPASIKTYTDQAIKLIDYIANETGFIANTIRDVLRFIEDGVFNCPASTAATARFDAKVPVWRYRMYSRFQNNLIGGQGAYHASDIPIVMGTSERKTGAKNVEEQNTLIKNVMTAWATFAKDPQDGLTKLGWPKYNPKTNSLIRLGFENTGTPSFVAATQHDKNCARLVIPPSAPKTVT